MQKVTIMPDELGNVIRVSKNNPEFAHVRIVQEAVTFSMNGWVKKQSRSALIHGKLEDLQTIGIADNETLPGNIVIKESTNAFNIEDPDRDLKIAGNTGVVCCSHGEPIYRKSFYDATSLQEDELVPHTNGDAIKEANGVAQISEKDLDANAITLDPDILAEMKTNIEEEGETDEPSNQLEEDEIEDEVKEEVEIEAEGETFEL
tara:strand:+ start:6673 stop:7284 length:612 start_codon:yes stop_codon:yes gene_type:complete